MKLQEIFNTLSAGEFSQLSFGDGPGVLTSDVVQDKVLTFINRGLTDLFSRFNLRQATLTLLLQPDQTSYLLTGKHAVNGRGAVDPKYILDSVLEPFNEDGLVQILQVKTESGFELGLNDLSRPNSCMLSAQNRLEVPLSIVNKSMSLPACMITNTLTVQYQATHPWIKSDVGAYDPDRLEISLPRTHLTALCYYVGSLASNPVGLGQEFNAGNTYAAKYEAECLRLKNDGMEVQQRGDEDKFCSRGFV